MSHGTSIPAHATVIGGSSRVPAGASSPFPQGPRPEGRTHLLLMISFHHFHFPTPFPFFLSIPTPSFQKMD